VNRRIRGEWAAGALCALALLLYWGSLRNPLVFDDGQLEGGRFLRFDPAAISRFDLRWISTATFGWLQGTPGKDWMWQRLATILLHAGVASCLFLFLRRLFAAVLPAATPRGDWTALLGALLFLVHPAAVYGVAYLIQRSILMATLFSLLSLWLFLEGLLRNRRAWLVASAAAYFAAVFSKEHAVMLPAVAAALALLLRGWSWQAWRPLALPFALYAVIAALVVAKSIGLLGARYEPFVGAAVRQLAEPQPAAAAIDAYRLSIVNQGYLFFRYLLTWLLPWPGWMSIDVRPAFPAQLLAWPQAAGFLAWLAWPLAAIALLLRRGRAGLLGFAMLAPWLLALTEMAAVRIQEMFVLYRSYLWMALLPAAIPAALGGLRPRPALAILAAAGIALLPPFFDRLGTFSTDLAIWDDAVRKNTDAKAPYADRSVRNRGVAYYKLERYDEALADFNRALALDPGNAKAWLLRGSLHMRTARSAQALADFGRALALEPRDAEILGRRCVVLMRLKRLDEALADCTLAAELAPAALDSHISLGMVQALRGATAEAERHYRRALQIAPGAGVARYQYGVLLRGLGRIGEARREFAAACAAGVQPACRAAAVP
jgi:tetratricopeptide (TPR) repeat protein